MTAGRTPATRAGSPGGRTWRSAPVYRWNNAFTSGGGLIREFWAGFTSQSMTQDLLR